MALIHARAAVLLVERETTAISYRTRGCAQAGIRTTLTWSLTARASVTYTNPASAWPSATLPVTALTSDSRLTTLLSTLESPIFRSTVIVYPPTGTAGAATTSFTGLLRRS